MSTDKEVIVQAKIPPQLAKAIIAVGKAAPSLKKGERNTYGKYNYVSIDDYFEAIPKLAAEHKIWWRVRETSCQAVTPDAEHFKFHYEVDLFHEDGSVIPAYGQITIIHPLQGPQTSGSAMSYASKLFMRNAFMVVTGEEDADAVDPNIGEAKRRRLRPGDSAGDDLLAGKRDAVAVAPKTALEPRPAPTQVVPVSNSPGPKVLVPETADGWDAVLGVFETWLPECKAADELNNFWTDNIAAVERMQLQRPELYAKLLAAFKARKKEIKDAA